MTADPLAGCPADMRRIGRQLAEQSSWIDEGSGQLRSAGSTATSDWAGEAQATFLATVDSMLPAARRVIARIDAAAEVMTAYAEQVEAIQDEARRTCQGQAEVAEDRATNDRARHAAKMLVASDDAVEADRVQLRALRTERNALAESADLLDARWEELAQRRADLDGRTAALLSEPEVRGVRVGHGAALSALSDADILSAIAAMPPDELAVLEPSISVRLSSMSADRVARWWDSMGASGERSDAQRALVIGLPAVIGNLDGVAYWARDQANRITVQRALVVARRRVETLERSMTDAASANDFSRFTARHQELEEAELYLSRLTNFAAGAHSRIAARPDTVRQMISFRPGPPPLGAFSLGDLDTAAGVSYLVPGMTTTLGDTTVLMRAASNVLVRHQVDGYRDQTALVAWVGYEAPAAPPGSGSVFGMSSARVGAANLSADLAAFRSRRPDAQLDVIGHSFGSTTSALALHDSPELNVHSYVVMGSAGMPWQVPDANSTNAEKMYVAQAGEEWNVAAWGRMFSLEHRRNPAVGFGAESLDTSGVGRAVNIHGLSGDGDGHVGYLDSGTPTVLDIARATEP